MYIPTPTSTEIVSAITKTGYREGDVVAILIGEHNKPNLDQLVSALNKNGIEFFGGVFPAIIHDDQRYEAGAVIMVLPALARPVLVKGLDAGQIEIPDLVKIKENQDKKYTAMILVDGLTSNISLFLAEMFNRFGSSVNYFGGGAGSLSLKQEPCILTPEGVFQDAAVITFIRLESSLGVQHGWQKIMGPIVATKTRKNVIVELNWSNAFEVYREIVEADAGAKLTQENFFSIAKGYPFGIYKEGAEDIVRDPIMVNDAGELICVGEVPENAVLNILKGENVALIQAAGQAADDCQNFNGRKVYFAPVIDCISRVLFLEQDFGQELAMVKQNVGVHYEGCVPEGVLTLGEISSDGKGFLEFYNKTIVVGMLYE